jgi:outer membrane lipoprotein SlyB
MKKLILLLALIISVLVLGCTSKNTGYAVYGNNPNQQQQQYVGGGCGVTAPVEKQTQEQIYNILDRIETL